MAAAEEPKPNLRAKHVKQLTKTEMCKFFLSNRCGKGSRCPFAHNRSEIREKPDLNCTSMCRSFLQSGNCDNPLCTFAHCERDLRTTDSFFKTKMCRFASSGRCKHGESCRFAHSSFELNQEVAAAMAANGGSDSMSQADATTALGLDSGDSDDRGESTRSHSGVARLSPQVQARSTADSGDIPSDQSNSQDGNEPRQPTRSNRSAWSDPSDQSTRAETTASVMTPRGSGDSGQEESSMMPLPPLPGRRADDRARRLERRNTPAQRHSGRHCTTVMLTNVPQFLTQGSLLSLLEDFSSCMRGSFDFFFCPWNPYEDRNLGYAIINFFSRSVAAEFELQWSNQPLLPRAHGMKRLRVVPAALQGRAANLRHFSGFGLAHHTDPRFRPLVRSGPHEVLRPMALARELSQGTPQPTPGNAIGNRAVPIRSGASALPEDQPAQQTVFQGEYREPFEFATHQQPDMRWHDQSAPMLHQISGLGAADLQMGNGMQLGGGYDYDCGSGAETPELENEHPLSRQASAQAPPDALMQILANMQHQSESQSRGEAEPSRPDTMAQGNTRALPGPPTRSPMQPGYFETGNGGEAPRSYEGGAVGDFPFVVLQQGAADGAWQCRTKTPGTGGSDDIQAPMQPYWALVVPPGAAPPAGNLPRYPVGSTPSGNVGTSSSPPFVSPMSYAPVVGVMNSN